MFNLIRYRPFARCPRYFTIFLMVASVIYGMQIGGFPLPFWMNDYVNDFLCMPIVLVICRGVVRRIKSNADLSLPLGPVLVLTVFYAFFFEVYLPEFHLRYTRDVIDVLLYFSGSGFFLAVQHLWSSRTVSDEPYR